MAPSIEIKDSFRNLNKRGAEFYSGLVKTGKDLDTNHPAHCTPDKREGEPGSPSSINVRRYRQ
jgi:hypothetical protein